jgi:hypothetical protein
VNLHEVYKIQHFGSISETDSSQTGPWFLQIGPWNENIDFNVVPGRGQQWRWPESDEGKAGMGRERKGEWSRFI